MAGLIGLTATDIELQDTLRVGRWGFDGTWVPHPVVRLTTTLPVAVRDEEGPVVRRVRWGIPVGQGRPVGNARDDRLLESRLWASMLGRSHAVFAATAVYEMTGTKQRRSWWFRRVDAHPLLMPGLVQARRVHDEERLCGAIVTTEPNPFFKRFHDRQVCTLEPEEVHDWLACEDPHEALRMLRGPEVDAWEAVPIDDRIFGKGRRELEDLVPLGPPLRHGDPIPDIPEAAGASDGQDARAGGRGGRQTTL